LHFAVKLKKKEIAKKIENELKVSFKSFSKLRISSISEKEIKEEEKKPENDETSLEKKEEASHAMFFRH
jgi:hypothetical protein